MHRTSLASSRNSLGFVKHFDSIQNTNNIDETDEPNSVKHSDDATFQNIDRIQHGLTSVVVDDIFSLISSTPSESRLCAVDCKTSSRRNWNPRFSGSPQQNHLIDATESEDVTETTTTARSTSDAVDNIFETNHPQFERAIHDEDCAYTSQCASSIPSTQSTQEQQHSKASDTQRIQSIEQITSHLQRINMLKDDRISEYAHLNVDGNINERNLVHLNRCDGVTSTDENDVLRFNETKPSNSAAGGYHNPYRACGCVGPSKIRSLDRTNHESRRLLSINVDLEESNSDGYWTEEECGTATSSDLMTFPMVHDLKYSPFMDRKFSDHAYAPRELNPNIPTVHNEDDDHLSCASNSTSSSGCTIHLSIRSCQSSVTWYEGSRIDEIDISCHSSDLDDEEDDDDDALLSSSDDTEMYSTFT